MTAKRYIIGIFVVLAIFYSNFLSAQTFNLSTDDLSCIVGSGRIIVNITSGTAPYNYFLFDGDPFAGGNLIDSELNTLLTSWNKLKKQLHVYVDEKKIKEVQKTVKIYAKKRKRILKNFSRVISPLLRKN